MKVDDKYLPEIGERILFLQNRIAENKKQMYGGVVEVATAEKTGNKNTADQAEYMMRQIKDNIDLYEALLADLEKA